MSPLRLRAMRYSTSVDAALFGKFASLALSAFRRIHLSACYSLIMGMPVHAAEKARIKVVGVQFAANPEHLQGAEMTAEEQQRTINFLTALDEKRPRVSVRLEPTNESDKNAMMVRWQGRKCGYVRNAPEQKARARAAMELQGCDHCMAKVVEVKVGAKGWFYIEVETNGRTAVPTVDKNLWHDWNPGVQPMPKTEQMLMVEDATDGLDDVESLADLSEYVKVICTEGRHVLCSEIKRALETCVLRMETVGGGEMRSLSRDLEHHLAGMCSEHRLLERRKEWLPELLGSAQARTAWREWLHDRGADIRPASRLEMSEWLAQVEHHLANIPAIAPCQSDDDCSLLTCAFYTDITTVAFLRLLTLIIVRHRLRECLGMPGSTPVPPVEQVVREEELRFVAAVIDYCRTLTKVDQVETMRDFIYARMAYLPPEVKHRVDHLTDRFLPKDNTPQPQKIVNHFAEGSVRFEAGSTMNGEVVRR